MCFDVAEYQSTVIGFCSIGIHRNMVVHAKAYGLRLDIRNESLGFL
jgi:hypothetical protein